MSDEKLSTMDEQGRRLAAAFIEAEQEQSGARRSFGFRVGLPATMALVTCAVMAAVLFGGGDRSRVLTVDEAVAAVQHAVFDQPTGSTGVVLYESHRTANAAGGIQRRTRGFSALETLQTDTWHREGDKKGWIRFTVFPLEFPSAADRRAYEKLPRSVPPEGIVIVCRSVVAARTNNVDIPDMFHLPPRTKIPNDPAKVYRLFARSVPDGYVGRGGNDEVIWQSIAWAMRGGAPNLEPAQRAAVVGALAKIPGVTTMGATTDPLGNDSIGFARTVGGIRSRLYFDSRTSLTTYFDQATTRRQKVWSAPVPAGTVIWSQSLLDYRYRNSYPRLKPSTVKEAGKFVFLCPELRHSASRAAALDRE